MLKYYKCKSDNIKGYQKGIIYPSSMVKTTVGFEEVEVAVKDKEMIRQFYTKLRNSYKYESKIIIATKNKIYVNCVVTIIQEGVVSFHNNNANKIMTMDEIDFKLSAALNEYNIKSNKLIID